MAVNSERGTQGDVSESNNRRKEVSHFVSIQEKPNSFWTFFVGAMIVLLLVTRP